MGIYDTKREAVQEWVRGFNAIPQGLIEKAYGSSFDEFREITPITEYQCDACGHSFNRKEYDSEVGCPKCNDDEVYAVEPYDFLPMWRTMWTFETGIDEEWVRNNLEIVANCGFRIYDSNELGIVIGIDGAIDGEIDGAYNFYENHWIPLYDARGLKWHRQP